MSMPQDQRETTSDDAAKPDSAWSTRKKLLIWSACGFSIPIVWFSWTIFGWLPAVEISRETTWLIEPLREDGYVDYVGFLKDQHEKRGGTVEGQDPWFQIQEAERLAANDGTADPKIPVYVDPLRAFANALSGELSEAEKLDREWTFRNKTLPQLQIMPWTAADHPAVADALKKSDNWFRHIEACFTPVASVGFPVSHTNELTDTAGSIALPATYCTREFAQRFLLRASFRFGENDLEGALRDIKFVSRAASRCQLCMIDLQSQAAIEDRLTITLCHGLLATEKIDPASIRLLKELPVQSFVPQFLDRLQVERMIVLDSLSCLHRLKLLGDRQLHDPRIRSTWDWIAARRRAASVNWDAMFRHENKLINSAVQTVISRTPSEAYRTLVETFDQTPLAPSSNDLADINPWSTVPDVFDYRSFLAIHHPSVAEGFLRTIEMQLRRRIVQIVIRLAVWKQNHGRFPVRLNELRSMDGFQITPDEIFSDPFTGDPLLYTATDEGFELTSLGINGRRDNGGTWGLLDEKDTGLQPLDDYIWKWPVGNDNR